MEAHIKLGVVGRGEGEGALSGRILARVQAVAEAIRHMNVDTLARSMTKLVRAYRERILAGKVGDAAKRRGPSTGIGRGAPHGSFKAAYQSQSVLVDACAGKSKRSADDGSTASAATSTASRTDWDRAILSFRHKDHDKSARSLKQQSVGK